MKRCELLLLLVTVTLIMACHASSARGGAELVKTRAVTLDFGARAYALLGMRHGTHLLLQPALALHVAY